jgi:tetratricopeptide (TPR) repeat protein
VARDVFRKAYFQEDQNQFRKTHALLADYFQQQADELVTSEMFLPEQYEDEEWRELMAEFLYYNLFGKGKEGLQKYIEQVFTAVYLQVPDVFMAPFAFIRAEMSEENLNLLPRATGQFFEDSEMALIFGWHFLNKPPRSYEIKFEGENTPSEPEIEAFSKQIEESIQLLLKSVSDLKDSLGKCAGLVYKSLRCNRFRERTDLLLQAKIQCEKLTHCHPKLKHTLFSSLGDLLESVKLYKDSLDCYQKALELDQSNASTFVGQGVALGKLERDEEALESFEKAIDLDPESVDAWKNRGAALRNLERYEEALESLQKALGLDPEYVDAWVIRGFILSNLWRYEEALASYKKALDLEPKSVSACTHQGTALLHLERYEEALTACDRAFKIDSKNPEALNIQALALSLIKNFEKAITAIDEAINLEPKEVLYRANRGIILARAGRYTEALADCEHAIKQKPKHESGYYGKACCYALQGDIGQAIDNLQKAIDIAPGRSRREAKQNPDFDSIRDDEGFRALMQLASF